MLQLLIGLSLSATSVALLVKLLPRGETPHPLLARRGVGAAVPLLIVIGIVFGVSLVISGLAG